MKAEQAKMRSHAEAAEELFKALYPQSGRLIHNAHDFRALLNGRKLIVVDLEWLKETLAGKKTKCETCDGTGAKIPGYNISWQAYLEMTVAQARQFGQMKDAEVCPDCGGTGWRGPEGAKDK